MQIFIQCPSCDESVTCNKIHRTFFDKLLNKQYYKFRCTNCSAEVFSHRSHQEVKLHREGDLVL
jgi:hypothetical protein